MGTRHRAELEAAIDRGEPVEAAFEVYLQDPYVRTRCQPPGALALFASQVAEWIDRVPEREEAKADQVAEVDGGQPAAGDKAGAPSEKWARVLGEIHDSGKTYAVHWLSRLRAVGERDGRVVIDCPDRFFRDWVRDHYEGLLSETFATLDIAGFVLVAPDD